MTVSGPGARGGGASHEEDLIPTDIHAYLAQHERKEILKFLTCGSVDDGKSTLIGRLLHDSKMIYEDQLDAVVRDSKTTGTQRDWRESAKALSSPPGSSPPVVANEWYSSQRKIAGRQ